MYKILLWDLDDTLWNFRLNGKLALEEVFNKFELIKFFDSFELFYKIYSRKNHELWNEYAKGQITKEFLRLERFLYPLRVVGHEDVELAMKMGPEFLDRTTKKKNLVDGAIDILEKCKGKYKMAIISNGFEEVQYTKLQGSGLLPYFDEVFLSDDIGCQKPDVRFFEEVLSRLGAKNEECLVIGDNFSTDIEGALDAKIDAVYFDRDENMLESDKIGFYRIEKLQDLESILL